MKTLIKPPALKKGDTIATISLSWGGAGKFPQRYQIGKTQFENAFDVKIVETPHALCSPEELYAHPEYRLDDLMEALLNPDIKGILCNIGGDDTIRLRRLMTEKHFDIIRNNPKIFMGISDSTINHYMFYHAGVASFYSASLLFGYAENGGIPQIMIENTKKTLFDTNPVGTLPESTYYIMEQIDWSENTRIRQHTPTTPWRYIQGNKPIQGKLIGGCFDSLMECMIGTDLFPPVHDFENTVLFIETSEERPTLDMVKYWLRIFGTNGILAKLNGILFGRPGGEFNASEQKEKEKYLAEMTRFDDVFLQVCREYDRTDLPIVTNMDFGHQVPQLILPFGATVEINPLKKTVSILDSAVV